MKQKGLAPIVIVVLIATLAVGGYLIYKLPRTSVPPPTPQATPASSPTPSPSPAPTDAGEITNWKIYTNQKDAILFRYPDGWRLTIKENTYEGYDDITVSRVVKVPMPDQPNKTVESIEEEFYIYPVKDTGKAQFIGLEFNTKKLVDNIECKGKESEGSPQVPPSRYYECTANNINFGIRLTSVNRNYSTLNQILSTFKFTN